MFDRLLTHAWGELIEYFFKLFRLLIPCDADYISLHWVNQSEFIPRSVFDSGLLGVVFFKWTGAWNVFP